MITKSNPISRPEPVTLEKRSVLAEKISKAFPKGEDKLRDYLVSHFTALIGDHVINARGLALMWERSILECQINPSQSSLRQAESYFPAIASAIVPEETAKAAIEFRDEFLKEENIIRARA